MVNLCLCTNPQILAKMEDFMVVFGEDNECKYKGVPFLLETKDGPDNLLSVTVAFPVTGRKTDCKDIEENRQIKNILENAIPVYPSKKDIYNITFNGYILYQIRNESFCSLDNYEEKIGTHFVIYTKSRLLDYLNQVTDCQVLPCGTYYPGKWKHYGIITNNHILDIISDSEPVITAV